MNTPAKTSASTKKPRPSVTREQVAQRCLRFVHHFISVALPWSVETLLAAQDELDDVPDLRVVGGLERLVLFLVAVDLDRRVRGEVLVERRLRAGLAAVLLGDRLVRRTVLL